MTLETFSRNAADLVRLRRALYGVEDTQALVLRCYARSKSEKINERTVLAVWDEMDKASHAALDAAGVPR